MGWSSAGIRILFITALCTLWLNKNVNAMRIFENSKEELLVPQQSETQKVGALAKSILESIFKERHDPFLRELATRTGEATDDELIWQKANPKWTEGPHGIKLVLSPQELRQKITDEIFREMNYQTVAVGVDRERKKVVIAGNIKATNYLDIQGKENLGKDISIKQAKKALKEARVRDVGFVDSDEKKIHDLVAHAYPGYSFEVISPSDEDITQAREAENNKKVQKGAENKEQEGSQGYKPARKATTNELLRAEAQSYHAEMQIAAYIKEDSGGVMLVASKGYCKECLPVLRRKGFSLDETIGEGSQRPVRWKEPSGVKIILPSHRPVQSVETPGTSMDFSKEVDMLQQSGGACGGFGSRRRRSACSGFQDFTEIDGDVLHEKIVNLPDEQREMLLVALEKVGTNKLFGKPSAMDGIHAIWRRWKTTTTIKVIEALKTENLIYGLIRGDTKSFQLEKTALSPTILAQSLNRLQEEELSAFEEEHERFKTGEIEEPKNLNGLGYSYKFVKTANLALIGKNLIGGALNGDTDSMLQLGGLFAADRVLTKAGDMMVIRGTQLAEHGERILGTALRITGPIFGAATVGFSINSLVGHVNELKFYKQLCRRNDSLFQDRVRSDCKLNTDTAIANTVSDSAGIVSTVALTVGETLTALSVETGPAGIVFAAADAVLMIGTQVYAAVEKVTKISSSLVGGLHGWENFETGFESFLGIAPPSDIDHLLDMKNSYNSDVNLAVNILKTSEAFQTYIAPTTHTRDNIKTNCKMVRQPISTRKFFFEWFISPGWAIYSGIEGEEKQRCDFKHEFEEDSDVDFQSLFRLHQFRVEPDTPSWGQLDCTPNSLANLHYPNDPEYYGTSEGFLCHNIIAVTAPDRPDLPVIVDLKNGTDQIVGFRDRKHIFIVGNGFKKFTGGAADDIFHMKSIPYRGKFDGAGGRNTLVLDYDRDAVTDLHKFCDETSPSCYSFMNIHRVVGRRDTADHVRTACSTTDVQLLGGRSGRSPDRISLAPRVCTANTTIQLGQFSWVMNKHKANGNFTYVVDFTPNVQVNLKAKKNLHRIIFSNDVISANFVYRLKSLTVFNKKEGQDFKLIANDVIKFDSLPVMTQAGLFIRFDKQSNQIFGAASPSKGNVSGLVSYPNRFIVSTSAPVNIKGGQKDDIFTFSGTNTPSGSIDGCGGGDSIVIEQDFNPEQVAAVDFVSNALYSRCKPSQAGAEFSQGCELNTSFKILSVVENVIGRPALADEVTANCGLKWLDLRGGKSSEASDLIQIPPARGCPFEMTLMIPNFTSVENLATSGNFNYRIDADGPSSITVGMDGCTAMHNYIFQQPSSSVTQITFNSVSRYFEIKFGGEAWSAIIPIERSKVYLADQVAVEFFPQVRGVVLVESNSTVGLHGLRDYPNTFVLQSASTDSWVIGGRKDDTFVVKSEIFYGNVSGGEGNNTMVLADAMWTGQQVLIDGVTSTLSVKKGNGTEHQIGFNDIQRFLGREGQSDVVQAGCDTSLIDTRGGRRHSTYDLLHVPSYLDCYFNLDVAIRPNLVVINDATEGDFTYEGDFRGGNTSVFLKFSEETEQKVVLAMDFLQLKSLKIDEGRVTMTTMDRSEFSTDIFVPLDDHTHSQPSISFHDGLQLKISHYGDYYSSTLFGILRNASSEDLENLPRHFERNQLMQRYRDKARGTQINVVMQVKDDTLVTIGCGGRFDILTAAPGYEENILVSSNFSDETIFRIAHGARSVRIYTHPQSDEPKWLDLTQVVNGDSMIEPTLCMQDNNPRISIGNVSVVINRSSDSGLNNYDQMRALSSWQVLLRETYLRIQLTDDNKLEFVPPSIVFDPKKQDTLVLNTPTLEYGMTIYTKKAGFQFSYQGLQQENNLVMTNLFVSLPFENIATVVFYKFYNYTSQVYTKNVRFEIQAGIFVQLAHLYGDGAPAFEKQEYVLANVTMV